jgi:hypothetical protein
MLLTVFVTAGAALAQDQPTASEHDAWIRVRGTSDPKELELFLARYPSSGYAEIARGKLGLIDRARLLDQREGELAAAQEEHLRQERADRLHREREERERLARETLDREQEAKRRAAEAAERVREERLARERAALEKRLEAIREKREAVERARADQARLRAEQVLKRLEEGLIQRKKIDSELQRRHTPQNPAPAAEPAAPLEPMASPPLQNGPRSRMALL